MIDNPIFIVGSARSGSVFLGEVLKKHPDIHCLIERPDVFNYATYLAMHPSIKAREPSKIKKTLKRLYKNAWKINPENCRTCSDVCRKAGGILNASTPVSCRSKSAKRYADKSHQHLLNVSLLRDAFPSAQFLHIIRDGRDVVSSMLSHQGVLAWFSEQYINQFTEWPQPWYGIENNEQYMEWSSWSTAKKCALRWVSWIRIGRETGKTFPANQWLDIYYEDLVLKPVETGETIYRFLDLKMNADSLNDAHPSSVGKWKDRLSGTDIDDILSVSEETLRDLRYIK